MRAARFVGILIAAGAIGAIGAVASARPARADDVDGESLIAIGLGPGPTVTGALAQHFQPGHIGARMRMGGRFGRLGVELEMTVSNFADDGSEPPAVHMWGTSLSYDLAASPWFHFAPRAGLVAGAIEGVRVTRPHTCTPTEDPCLAVETVDSSDPGFGLDLGGTFQLELGRRRGGRAVLWMDVGTMLARFQLPDGVVSGRITQITIGIGHGMRF